MSFTQIAFHPRDMPGGGTAILGRESIYSDKSVTWKELGVEV